MSDTIEINGATIQHDSSGAGHHWRNATVLDTPVNIVMEIAAEIIDGGVEECDDYLASNGQHYRWSTEE